MRTKIQRRPKMICHMQIICLRLWLLHVDPLRFTWQWDLWVGSCGCFEHGHWALLFWRLALSRYNRVLCVQEREQPKYQVAWAAPVKSVQSQQGKCRSRWNLSVFNVLARLERTVPCWAAACAWAWEGQCLSVRLASERKRFSSLDLYLNYPVLVILCFMILLKW